MIVPMISLLCNYVDLHFLTCAPLYFSGVWISAYILNEVHDNISWLQVASRVLLLITVYFIIDLFFCLLMGFPASLVGWHTSYWSLMLSCVSNMVQVCFTGKHFCTGFLFHINFTASALTNQLEKKGASRIQYNGSSSWHTR